MSLIDGIFHLGSLINVCCDLGAILLIMEKHVVEDDNEPACIIVALFNILIFLGRM